MSIVNDLHDQAMEIADQDIQARRRGDVVEATRLARVAYVLEAQAAALVPDGTSAEPSRAILYRSAATLAYHGDEFEAAYELLSVGLAGAPPSCVRAELEELRDQVERSIDAAPGHLKPLDTRAITAQFDRMKHQDWCSLRMVVKVRTCTCGLDELRANVQGALIIRDAWLSQFEAALESLDTALDESTDGLQDDVVINVSMTLGHIRRVEELRDKRWRRLGTLDAAPLVPEHEQAA